MGSEIIQKDYLQTKIPRKAGYFRFYSQTINITSRQQKYFDTANIVKKAILQ